MLYCVGVNGTAATPTKADSWSLRQAKCIPSDHRIAAQRGYCQPSRTRWPLLWADCRKTLAMNRPG